MHGYVSGHGVFAHLSPARRDDIQRRLIVDIKAADLFGVVQIIDMASFLEHRPDFNARLEPAARQYNVAHAHAVMQCAQLMCLHTEHVTDEVIEFIVDQNKEFGGRTKAWYDHMRKQDDPRDRHRKRYGELVQGDHRKLLGLQAADFLAHSALKHALGAESWQWEMLVNEAHVIGRPLESGPKFWGEVAALARQTMPTV
jgi:hypothetical protein